MRPKFKFPFATKAYLLFLFIGSMLIPAKSFADIYPVKSGQWFDPTVWQLGRIPNGSDIVAITNTFTVLLDSGSTNAAICQDFYANTGGTFTLGSGYTLTVNEWFDGGFGGTVTLNTGSSIIMTGITGFPHLYAGSITFSNLIISTGSILINSPVTVQGDFIINAGATATGSLGTMNIGGNWSNSGTYIHNNGVVNFNGTSAQNIDGSSTTTFQSFVNSNTSSTISAGASIVVNNIMTLNASTILDMTTYTLGGTISTLSGTGILKTQNTSATPITAGKTWAGTVEYSGTGAAQTAVTGNYMNLVINNSNGVGIGGNITVTGTLTLTTGVLNIGLYTLTIAGSSPVRTSGSIDAGNPSATIIFTNSGLVNLPASVFSSNIKNLTMNGAGGININSPITIDGALTLTNGIISNSIANLITFSATGTTSGASNNSFINGPVNKTGNSAFVFPIGKTGSGFHAIGITAPTVITDAFTAEYIRLDPYSLGTILQSGLAAISSCEYWDLNKTNGSPTVNISLYGNANSGCNSATGASYFTGNGGTLPELRVCHFNSFSSTWENDGGATVGTSPDIITTSGPVSTFSPFTFGTIGSAPLPVKLTTFSVREDADQALLKWNTSSEINNDRFEIERSEDGKTYIRIGNVKGHGTTTNSINYFFIDRYLAEITVSTVFYRLKQVDHNGQFEYSNIITLHHAGAGNSGLLMISPAPNPFNDILEVNYILPEAGRAIISIVDALGRTIVREELNAIKGSNTARFKTDNYVKGLYFLKVNCKDEISNYQIIIKK